MSNHKFHLLVQQYYRARKADHYAIKIRNGRVKSKFFLNDFKIGPSGFKSNKNQ